jgi:hypothetical protein
MRDDRTISSVSISSAAGKCDSKDFRHISGSLWSCKYGAESANKNITAACDFLFVGLQLLHPYPYPYPCCGYVARFGKLRLAAR